MAQGGLTGHESDPLRLPLLGGQGVLVVKLPLVVLHQGLGPTTGGSEVHHLLVKGAELGQHVSDGALRFGLLGRGLEGEKVRLELLGGAHVQ